MQIVQSVDIEPVPDIFPIPIADHHVGSELFWLLLIVINRVEAGNLGEDRPVIRFPSAQDRFRYGTSINWCWRTFICKQ